MIAIEDYADDSKSLIVDAYRNDLAYIHDAGCGDFATHAASVVVEALHEQGIERGLVIDLGCGSGLLAELLVAAGYEIEGIDISRAMVARARRRVPRARFHVGSFVTFRLPQSVAAVTAIGECVNYLFDPQATRAALNAVFTRIFDALLPGGLFLFDAAEPGRAPAMEPVRNHMEGAEWAVLSAAHEDRGRRLLTRHITSFRKVGRLYRRDHEVHRLRLYPRADLVAELGELGFRVRILRRYGRLSLPRGLVGYLARKPL